MSVELPSNLSKEIHSPFRVLYSSIREGTLSYVGQVCTSSTPSFNTSFFVTRKTEFQNCFTHNDEHSFSFLEDLYSETTSTSSGLNEGSRDSTTKPESTEAVFKKNKPKKKHVWVEEYDSILKSVVSRYKCDWKRILKRIYILTKVKCTIYFLKERYKKLSNHQHEAKRVPFTHEEDLLIVRCINKYGTDFEKIAKHFKTRKPMMIKNRYYSYIRKKDHYNELLEECALSSEVLPSEDPEESSTNYEEYDSNRMENDPIVCQDKIRIRSFEELESNQAYLCMTFKAPDEELSVRITPLVSNSLYD